jgi:hypothetical protein
MECFSNALIFQYHERFQSTALKYEMLSFNYTRNVVKYKHNFKVKYFKLLYISVLITKLFLFSYYSLYFTLSSLNISCKEINPGRNM